MLRRWRLGMAMRRDGLSAAQIRFALRLFAIGGEGAVAAFRAVAVAPNMVGPEQGRRSRWLLPESYLASGGVIGVPSDRGGSRRRKP